MDRTIVMSDNTINNLKTFLNRVPITGFKEMSAMNEILTKLFPQGAEKLEEG